MARGEYGQAAISLAGAVGADALKLAGRGAKVAKAAAGGTKLGSKLGKGAARAAGDIASAGRKVVGAAGDALGKAAKKVTSKIPKSKCDIPVLNRAFKWCFAPGTQVLVVLPETAGPPPLWVDASFSDQPEPEQQTASMPFAAAALIAGAAGWQALRPRRTREEEEQEVYARLFARKNLLWQSDPLGDDLDRFAIDRNESFEPRRHATEGLLADDQDALGDWAPEPFDSRHAPDERPSLTNYTPKQTDHDVCDTREHRRHGFTPKLLGRGISPTPRHDVLRPESPPPTPPDLQSRKVSSRPSSRRRSVARVLWLVGFVLLAGYFALPGIKRSDGPSPSHIAKTRTVASSRAADSPNANTNANANTSISSAELARLAGGSARVVQKNIEDVVEGDRVLAWDDETGQQVVRPVVRTFKNVSDHLRVVRVRGSDGTTQEIKTTNEHPFWVPDKGWVSAKDLETGTRLVQSDGQSAQVEQTSLEVKPKGTCVYNFEVMGAHNYYISADAIRGPPVLVHNICATAAGKATQKAVQITGKAAHKNCLASTAINHGYIIYNKLTGELYKVGISAGKILASGKSARAQAQIAEISVTRGVRATDIGTKVIRQNLPGRAAALYWEEKTVGTIRSMGHALIENVRPTGF